MQVLQTLSQDPDTPHLSASPTRRFRCMGRVGPPGLPLSCPAGKFPVQPLEIHSKEVGELDYIECLSRIDLEAQPVLGRANCTRPA